MIIDSSDETGIEVLSDVLTTKNDINNSDSKTNDVKEQENENNDLDVSYSSTNNEQKINNETEKEIDGGSVKKRTPKTKITRSTSEIVSGVVSDFINLPSGLQEEIINILTKSDTLDVESSEKSREWFNTVRDGLEHTTRSEIFVSGLDKPEAEFDNEIKYNNIDLGIKTPKFNSNNLSGEKALFRTLQDLGLGSIKTVPLFNSGFHVIIKPHTEIELLELNRRMAENKVLLGIQSKGLVYSNTAYYLIECIIDFIRSHIYNTSLQLDIGEDIMDYIVAQDIFDLIWGMLCVMFPSGFNYKRGCTSKPSECQYVATELLHLDECQFVNKNALNDWQKSFMSRIELKSKTKEEVKRYQDEITCMSMRSVDLISNDKVTVRALLRAPTVNEYIRSGNLWVNTISDKINDMLSINDDNEQRRIEKRNEFIIEAGRATTLRQYSHYVLAIEEVRGDSVNTHKDTESINKYLNVLSSDVKIRNTFFKYVVNYISDSTVSVIGIPVFDCPSCKNAQTQGTEIHGENLSEVIPLDMLTCFFSLLTQKILWIGQR